MRLGQLARILEIRPAEIVEFLALKGIAIEDNTNTRLADDQVIAIRNHFNPEALNEAALETDKVLPVSVPESPDVTEPILAQSEDIAGNYSGVEISEGKPEVIKAPKVELTGLKIVGKIELPEAKKKPGKAEPQAEQGEPANPELPAAKPAQRISSGERRRQRPEHRPGKNPVALQREREAMEEKKNRAERAEREKERKTRNYYKKVKLSPPTKAVRMVNEPVMQMSAQELEEPPRTWFGRLIKWLTNA